MLQQILSDGFIDPELLAELDEEQKQVLFCKMREEQVRKWEENEKKQEKLDKQKANKPKVPRKPGAKSVKFLEGRDKNPWVWVMGEHKDDKTIEQILEEEAREKARELAEREAEELRKQEEEEEARRLKEEQERLEEEKRQRMEKLRKEAEEKRIAKEKLEEERRRQEEERTKSLKAIKRKSELSRRASVQRISNLQKKRTNELCNSFREARKKILHLAEEQSSEVEQHWRESEKKAKQADERRRSIARDARQEYRNSLKAVMNVAFLVGPALHQLKKTRPQPPPRESMVLSEWTKHVIPKNLSTRPRNREAVVSWFREVERQKGVGKEGEKMAPWFHGIISRQASEELLETCPKGSFLVRLSEKVWGYAVSYRAEDRCKHYLIDASDNNYVFFGTNQIAHPSLADLVKYHQTEPITFMGQEKLQIPCPQSSDPPDYCELFHDTTDEVSYL